LLEWPTSVPSGKKRRVPLFPPSPFTSQCPFTGSQLAPGCVPVSVADFTADARSAVRAAIGGDAEAVERELQLEQERERAADRAYWAPLRQELEHLRRHT